MLTKNVFILEFQHGNIFHYFRGANEIKHLYLNNKMQFQAKSIVLFQMNALKK